MGAEVETASIEVWQALATQLWETLEWIQAVCATEGAADYSNKLMNSPLVVRMVEHAIGGRSESEAKPATAFMMEKAWIAWSLAPPSVQETLADLMAMYKRTAYTPQGLGPNDLWIDDDGTVMYPEPVGATTPPPPPPPPPAPPYEPAYGPDGKLVQTKYSYENPPLQHQGGSGNLPLPSYPPVPPPMTPAEKAQMNLDLLDPYGPEIFHG